MSESKLIDRRAFFKQCRNYFAAGTSGLLLTNQAMAVALDYVESASKKSSLQVFTAQQLAQLRVICGLVIPRTDTPGADDANVDWFIDNLLFHCYSKADHQRVFDVLTLIDSSAKTRANEIFLGLNQQAQFDLLTQLDKGQSPFNPEDRSQFKFLKGLIAFGYYTSKAGATKELSYQAVPGGFTGSIPYQDDMTAWGSKNYYHF